MIERAEWSAEFEEAIAPALGDDGPAVAHDVITGDAQAWVTDGPAAIVTRIEHTPNYRECVVVAMAGAGVGHVAPAIVAAARAVGCDRVRFHTTRPGLARLVGRDYDVVEVERVYQVRI